MTTSGFDVAVIGGGLVGAALAYGMADAHCRVVVLDEGDRSLRAALGNFGLVWVQGKGADCPPYARWTLGSARRWPELAQRLQEETGIDVALSQPGGLHLCLSEREAALRAEKVARMQAQRVAPLRGPEGARTQEDGAAAHVEMLDRTALRRMLPDVGPDVVAASYCRDDGQVNPLRLLRALREAFERRGGTMMADAEVRAVAPEGGAFTLATARGSVHADRVVLAAGLGSVGLAPQLGLSAPLSAQRGQIVALARMPAMVPLPIETIRQTAEGTVLLGDSHEDTDSTETSTPVLASIARRALRALPGLADANVLRCWAALRVLTPDGLPVYEQSASSPGAFLATCHSGVTLAAAHALDIAPQIAAGAISAELEAFSSRRFDAGA
ncbi:MAG: FAD-dependent oxidoreductase [Betaproteobacteria bacterium]